MAKIKLSLLPGESVLLNTRPSELIMLPPVLIMLVAIYFPWYFLIRYSLAENYYLYMIVWTAAVFVYGVAKYIEKIHSRIIITSKRLIVTRNQGFFGRQQQELDLRYIQNVTLRTAGIIGSLARIKDVTVQGADPASKLILKGLDDADNIKDLLWQRSKSTL